MATTKADPKSAIASTKAVDKTYEGLTREDLFALTASCIPRVALTTARSY